MINFDEIQTTTVKDVTYETDNTVTYTDDIENDKYWHIRISFNDNTIKPIILDVDSDCCEEVWFALEIPNYDKEYDLEYLIGKTIKNITINDDCIDLGNDNEMYYHWARIVNIELVDGTTFPLYFCVSSNGYYQGIFKMYQK